VRIIGNRAWQIRQALLGQLAGARPERGRGSPVPRLEARAGLLLPERHDLVIEPVFLEQQGKTRHRAGGDVIAGIFGEQLPEQRNGALRRVQAVGAQASRFAA
jgi:hypothetical protein